MKMLFQVSDTSFTQFLPSMFSAYINPLSHWGGGALYAPLPFLFACYLKLSWGTHTKKYLTLQTFLLRMPLWKKKQEI